MTYLKSFQNTPRGRGRKPSNLFGADNVRFDQKGHFVFPIPNNKRRRCMGEGCSSIVKTQCLKCDLGLCLFCFAPYPTV